MINSLLSLNNDCQSALEQVSKPTPTFTPVIFDLTSHSDWETATTSTSCLVSRTVATVTVYCARLMKNIVNVLLCGVITSEILDVYTMCINMTTPKEFPRNFCKFPKTTYERHTNCNSWPLAASSLMLL